jgi:hypothetical protein
LSEIRLEPEGMRLLKNAKHFSHGLHCKPLRGCRGFESRLALTKSLENQGIS